MVVNPAIRACGHLREVKKKSPFSFAPDKLNLVSSCSAVTLSSFRAYLTVRTFSADHNKQDQQTDLVCVQSA